MANIRGSPPCRIGTAAQVWEGLADITAAGVHREGLTEYVSKAGTRSIVTKKQAAAYAAKAPKPAPKATPAPAPTPTPAPKPAPAPKPPAAFARPTPAAKARPPARPPTPSDVPLATPGAAAGPPLLGKNWPPLDHTFQRLRADAQKAAAFLPSEVMKFADAAGTSFNNPGGPPTLNPAAMADAGIPPVVRDPETGRPVLNDPTPAEIYGTAIWALKPADLDAVEKRNILGRLTTLYETAQGRHRLGRGRDSVPRAYRGEGADLQAVYGDPKKWSTTFTPQQKDGNEIRRASGHPRVFVDGPEPETVLPKPTPRAPPPARGRRTAPRGPPDA